MFTYISNQLKEFVCFLSGTRSTLSVYDTNHLTITTFGRRSIIVSLLASVYMTEMECFQGANAAVEVYLPLDRRVCKTFHSLIITVKSSTYRSC